jgi:hypothetical protein
MLRENTDFVVIIVVYGFHKVFEQSLWFDEGDTSQYIIV